MQQLAQWKSATYLHISNPQELVKENQFRHQKRHTAVVPSFADARQQLPNPYWDGHDDAIACWWKVWKLAWQNIHQPTAENGFVAPHIDTAFNGNLFLWDSVFALLFARYGSRVFNFQQTLDNFYAVQHEDGFICRELRPEPNGEMFYPHDPASTGPNVFAWCEWDYFLNTGDRERLGRVFPVLLAYHRWLRTFRTWPDGSYFQSGLASGMDNQPVDEAGNVVQAEYRHMSRLDATAQALLSARRLCEMATVLNRQADVEPEQKEIDNLQQLINTHAHHPADGFYYHWHPQHGRSLVKSIGAYWTLLAQAISDQHLPQFVQWLDDENTFNRPHRVPSLAKDNHFYCAEGGYWRGGVWPPTNYMVLCGLTQVGYDELAYEIACNHHDNVVQVFNETDTVWEFYAPEAITQGYQQNGTSAVSDFVGWSGLGPIAVLLEYRFGLRPHVPEQTLVWDIRELDAFGVTRYPFGQDGLLDLHCAARTSYQEKPQIEVKSNCQLTLLLRWANGQQQIDISPNA